MHLSKVMMIMKQVRVAEMVTTEAKGLGSLVTETRSCSVGSKQCMGIGPMFNLVKSPAMTGSARNEHCALGPALYNTYVSMHRTAE